VDQCYPGHPELLVDQRYPGHPEDLEDLEAQSGE
jgi:hypothetical protein